MTYVTQLPSCSVSREHLRLSAGPSGPLDEAMDFSVLLNDSEALMVTSGKWDVFVVRWLFR